MRQQCKQPLEWQSSGYKGDTCLPHIPNISHTFTSPISYSCNMLFRSLVSAIAIASALLEPVAAIKATVKGRPGVVFVPYHFFDRPLQNYKNSYTWDIADNVQLSAFSVAIQGGELAHVSSPHLQCSRAVPPS